jgi:hypothetical protein
MIPFQVDHLAERIQFTSAIVYARNIDVKKAPVKGSSAHRQQFAKLDYGFFIIEEKWYPKK